MNEAWTCVGAAAEERRCGPQQLEQSDVGSLSPCETSHVTQFVFTTRGSVFFFSCSNLKEEDEPPCYLQGGEGGAAPAMAPSHARAPV